MLTKDLQAVVKRLRIHKKEKQKSGQIKVMDVGRIRKVGRFAHFELRTSGKPAFRLTTN